eukprot:c17854_g1_i1.p1 GENE.c17854_g1_i1~~c17854_g1_i1.p1  ORF type:complete len:707 (-),score=163.79 c17854_g1_i1:51-1958(-)
MGIPPFHYGSHYSTAGIVLFYLIRLEPFTTWNISLQGGKFDVADRLFNSIESAWTSSQTNTTDVKELTPEFYYLPHFLENTDNFPLGKRDGEPVGDVQLPPWAESPVDFINKMRCALESDEVSRKLNNWIDLIFGYKQRGKAAEDNFNIFYYLTYEGAVDIKDLEEKMATAIVQQVKYFGQTPSQLLLDAPHPKRKLNLIPRSLFKSATKIKMFQLERWHPRDVPIESIHLHARNIVSISATGAFAVFDWVSNDERHSESSGRNTQPTRVLPFALHLSMPYFSSVSTDAFQITRAEVAPLPSIERLRRLDKHVCSATSPSGKLIFYGRRWDGSVAVVSAQSGRVVQVVKGHSGVVDCVCVAQPTGTAVVSGGRDCRVAVWGVVMEASKGFVGVTTGARDDDRWMDSEKRFPLSIKPLRYLHGHASWVVCVAASSDLDCVISASVDGCLLQHTLAKGRLVRRLVSSIPAEMPTLASSDVTATNSPRRDSMMPTNDQTQSLIGFARNSVTHLAISSFGDIVVCTQKREIIHFLFNGSTQAAIAHPDTVTALAIAHNSSYVTVGSRGNITVFDLNLRMQRIHRFKLDSSVVVRCIASFRPPDLTRDVVFCGLDSGHMVVLHNIDTTRTSISNPEVLNL